MSICQDVAVVRTPLSSHAWKLALVDHVDRAFVRYILDGLHNGFRIGFQSHSPLHSATHNMPSARENPEVVQRDIDDELARARFIGPVSEATKELVHVNRFGVIPKGHNSGKWRLITDLSFPDGASVNGGISADLCSLQYTSVEEVAGIIARLGEGTMLAKVDVEAAYRLVPVHPQDRLLQGVQWPKGKVYVDPMLPFGLRSAPKIFNAITDALEGILKRRGVRYCEHYLDDFILIGAPGTRECHAALEVLDEVCGQLGVPMAAHKREEPTTCLTFLGIEINTMTGTLSLPKKKLDRLVALLAQWGAPLSWRVHAGVRGGRGTAWLASVTIR